MISHIESRAQDIERLNQLNSLKLNINSWEIIKELESNNTLI